MHTQKPISGDLEISLQVCSTVHVQVPYASYMHFAETLDKSKQTPLFSEEEFFSDRVHSTATQSVVGGQGNTWQRRRGGSSSHSFASGQRCQQQVALGDRWDLLLLWAGGTTKPPLLLTCKGY